MVTFGACGISYHYYGERWREVERGGFTPESCVIIATLASEPSRPDGIKENPEKFLAPESYYNCVLQNPCY
jgi:hypothetical protein